MEKSPATETAMFEVMRALAREHDPGGQVPDLLTELACQTAADVMSMDQHELEETASQYDTHPGPIVRRVPLVHTYARWQAGPDMSFEDGYGRVTVSAQQQLRQELGYWLFANRFCERSVSNAAEDATGDGLSRDTYDYRAGAMLTYTIVAAARSLRQ
jgi:hypothetical protein